MQTSTHKPLYWGRTYDERGSHRFVFWHRHNDGLIEISGFLRNHEPIIESLKQGKRVRPTAGLPHFGYAFEWEPLEVGFSPFEWIDLGRKLEKWLSDQK